VDVQVCGPCRRARQRNRSLHAERFGQLPNETVPPDGYYGTMTKQQALDQLVGLDGTRPNEATALKVMAALISNATLDEVAGCLSISTETLVRSYPGAIAEAGRPSSVRHPNSGPAVSEAPKPLYVPNR
jgi:hypothetical protein